MTQRQISNSEKKKLLERSQLPKAKKTIVDIDDENATLLSIINNVTLVPPEHVRDPGSQLYWRILYTWRMTPKLVKETN